MSLPLTTPIRDNQRIRVIDSIRGVALLGILLMNIPFFAAPFQFGQNISLRSEFSGPNYYTWWIVEGAFEGTMRALFSMLFGAGCILLLERLARNPQVDPAKIYYRRLLWLLLFGMFNAYILLWPGDILYAYAICGLFLYPFKDMKAKHLFMFALLFLLVMTVKSTYQMWKMDRLRAKGEYALALEKAKQKLTPEQEASKGAWMGFQEKTKKENVLKEAEGFTKQMQGNYFTILSFASGWSAKLQSSKLYHSFFLDNMIMIFLGMALFRWGVLTGKRSRRFYWLLMAGGYALGLPLSYYEHRTLININFDPTLMLDRFLVNFYEIRRILLALGHLGVLMLLYRYGLFRLLFNWLARVGQMAFSNYLMQTIICGIVFYGIGFGLYGRLQRYEMYYVVLCVWIFQIIFSNIWLHYFRFGPFEWAWRSLTYWRRQPWKRSTVVAEASDAEPVAPAIA
ncbi:MAG TPA: DUF418 domain-containing protein [Flavisolibacter sp.]